MKVSNAATSIAYEKGRDAKMLELRISVLKDVQRLSERKRLAGCNKEIKSRKVADVKGVLNNFVDGMRRCIFNSYVSILQNVNQTLLVVGSRLRKLIDRKSQKLQRSVYAAFCDTAGGVQVLFVGVPEIVDRSLYLIVGHGKRDESPTPRSFSTHSASCASQQGGERASINI